MQGRKKHILLILLLLLIAFVSMQMMAGQNYTEEKTRIMHENTVWGKVALTKLSKPCYDKSAM